MNEVRWCKTEQKICIKNPNSRRYYEYYSKSNNATYLFPKKRQHIA